MLYALLVSTWLAPKVHSKVVSHSHTQDADRGEVSRGENEGKNAKEKKKKKKLDHMTA